MMPAFRLIAALLFTALSAGCATPAPPPEEPLTPMPAAIFRDPGDAAFMEAIAAYIRTKNAPQNSRYEFTRLDLNGDGRREGIAMMIAPHGYWCTFDGCSMAVFEAFNDSFALTAEISPVRGPLTVSKTVTQGWKDILIRISGHMDSPARTVALRYDGHTYPAWPGDAPPLRYAWNTPAEGVRIFP